MTITTRSSKGSQLTWTELDTNFTDLRDGVRLQIPKEQGGGLRIGPDSDLTFGWTDLQCNLYVPDWGAPNAPTFESYRGGIKQMCFAVNDEIQLSAHLNHDYVMGTDVFVHVHWSSNDATLTGGSVTWGFELIYAKGHQQMAFTDSIVITEQQNASTTQYMHHICEAPASISGGSANLLDTAVLEVDGLLQGRAYLVANDLTYTGPIQPCVYLHQIDIHHQSTGAPTKRRMPNFWV